MYLTPRIIDLIIPDDVNINTRDGDGKTPLHNACRFGYSSAVINKLLTVGANVNAETDEGQTALYLASEKGYDAIVAILLAAGADVNIADSTEDGLGFTPLHIASLNGYDAVVAKLLAAGANVNMVEGTMARAPLHAASIRGHDAVTAILLAAGASVNAMDNRENTPLWLASEHGHEAVVTRLLAAGADVNLASYNEQTPLCTAADYGRYEIVAILLAAGANVNTIDNSRKTPLYWASLHGDEAIVKLLLTDPVDPADPTLGRPSPISELDTYTPEIQALYDTYYKPVNMWTGFQLGLTSKSVDVINETITDYDKLLNSRIVRTPDGIVGTKYYNMDVAYCPICFIVLERGMNCNYVHHNCEQEYDLRNLKLSPTSKLLYDKHQERGQISICVICSRVCLGHIHTKLVPFAEVIRPAEPGRPEYKPTRNDLSMNPGRSPTAAEIALLPADEQIAKFDHDWTLDCRSYFNNPGGGTLEKIMRVHAFREKIKALEPERGKMLTNEAYKHILQAGWDAPINPTPEFKAVIKEEIRKNRVADAIAARAKATAKAAGANDAGVREAIIAAFPAAADVARAAAGAVPEATPATIEAAVAAVPSIDILRNRFNRPSSTFQGVIQGEEKESVNSIVYRTIWDVYRYPEVSWLEDVPSVDRPMYSPTVDLATAMNAIDLEDMPCQIVFKHRQSDNSRIIHSGNARFALHRIFVGDLAGTNTTADGALLSLKTRNRLWTTAGNFGACFMCTNSSTAGNCIIDIVSYPGLTPCTSKLYPQELQMALDKCTVLTAEERKTYQTILDEYRLKFNKHFASAEEKEKGAAIEKTYYLKIERAKAAARANNNAMQGKAGGLFNNINNGPAAPRRRKTRRRQRRAVTRKLRSRRIRSRQTRSRK
jgi:ankyrin repeat protein